MMRLLKERESAFDARLALDAATAALEVDEQGRLIHREVEEEDEGGVVEEQLHVAQVRQLRKEQAETMAQEKEEEEKHAQTAVLGREKQQLQPIREHTTVQMAHSRTASATAEDEQLLGPSARGSTLAASRPPLSPIVSGVASVGFSASKAAGAAAANGEEEEEEEELPAIMHFSDEEEDETMSLAAARMGAAV